MKLEDIPTYEISQESFVLIQRIEELLVQTRRITDRKVTLRLRKASMIRSINSSLAIEGNDMDLLNVRDIVNGKIVEGPFDEVLEVKNAIEAYRMAKTVDLWSIDDFLKVFDALMFRLIQSEGFRTFGVGVFEGDRLLYRAPDAEDVVPMMERLFTWGRTSNTHPAIKAAVVHFFIEAIHPFEDGNGRMSRLLTALLLHQEGYDICRYVSLESRINAARDRYYDALEASEEGWSDNTSDYTPFIEYFLGVLFLSYREYDLRLASAAGRLGKSAAVRDIVLNMDMSVSKRDLMAMVPGVSESTVEAELRRMLDAGEAVKIGSTRGARYAAASRIENLEPCSQDLTS